jgi:hypothetical protein
MNTAAEPLDVRRWAEDRAARSGAEPPEPWDSFGRWWAGVDAGLRLAVNAELAGLLREGRAGLVGDAAE